MENSPNHSVEMNMNQIDESYSDFQLITEMLPMQLRQETDYLTEWKIMKEFELTDIKKQLEISERIQQTQKENLLEVQMNCERLSQYLTNELENRDLLASKIDSSHEITSIIEQHIEELSTTLEGCIDSRDELHILLNEQSVKMENVNKQLKEFSILRDAKKNLINKVEKEKKLRLEEIRKLNILKGDYDKLKGHLEAKTTQLLSESSLHNKQRQEDQDYFQNKLLSLNTEITILQKENKLLMDEVDKIKKIEELNKKLLEENTNLKVEKNLLNVKIESTSSDLEMLRLDILKREEILNLTKVNEASLQGQVQILETIHRELETKCSTSNEKSNKLEQEIIHIKNEFFIEKEKLKSKYNDLENTLDEKDNILKSKESEFNELNAQLQAKEFHIQSLQAKINTQINETTELEKKCANLLVEIKSISEFKLNLENNLTLTKEKLNNELQLYEDSKKKWDSLKDELYLRIDEMEAVHKAEEKRLNQENEDLKMHSNEIAQHFESCKKECETVRQELDDLKTAYNVQEETMRREMDQLLAELRGDFLNKIKGKDLQISELRKETRDLNEKYSQMNHKNFVLESEFRKRKQEAKFQKSFSPPKTRKQTPYNKSQNVIQMALEDSWSEDSYNHSPKKQPAPSQFNLTLNKKTYSSAMGQRLSQTNVGPVSTSQSINNIENKKIPESDNKKNESNFDEIISILDMSS